MSTQNELYVELASLVTARRNCMEDVSGNPLRAEWKEKHEERLLDLVNEYMPSGSGIDSGTKIDLDASTSERLVFTFGFHHMNDGGYYDGWTEHTLTVKPSLQFGIDLRITGSNRNQIKDYLYETYRYALESTVRNRIHATA